MRMPRPTLHMLEMSTEQAYLSFPERIVRMSGRRARRGRNSLPLA